MKIAAKCRNKGALEEAIHLFNVSCILLSSKVNLRQSPGKGSRNKKQSPNRNHNPNSAEMFSVYSWGRKKGAGTHLTLFFSADINRQKRAHLTKAFRLWVLPQCRAVSSPGRGEEFYSTIRKSFCMSEGIFPVHWTDIHIHICTKPDFTSLAVCHLRSFKTQLT